MQKNRRYCVDTDVRSKDLSPTEKLELKIAIYKEEDRLIAVNGYKVSKMSY